MNKAVDKQRQAEATRILLRGRSAARGDREESRDQLTALFDEELQGLAQAADRRDRAGHTVDSPAVLSALYLRLVDPSRLDWSDRARFLQVGARSMRLLLTEQARAHRAAKRGGAWRRVAVAPGMLPATMSPVDVVVLGDAFERLSKRDARVASISEMFLLAGLTIRENSFLNPRAFASTS